MGINPSHNHLLEAYVNWILTPAQDRQDDEKTLTAFSIKIGISRVSLSKWARIPYFQERLLKLSKATLKTNTEKVKQKLLEVALDGDTQAMKLYLEKVAEINEKIDLNLAGKVEVAVDLKKLIEAEESDDSNKE